MNGQSRKKYQSDIVKHKIKSIMEAQQKDCKVPLCTNIISLFSSILKKLFRIIQAFILRG